MVSVAGVARKALAICPLTPIRRAISLLLQNPRLAGSVPADIDLPSLPVKGMDLLLELLEHCRSNEQTTTGTLIERHRQEPHFAALEKLASHDHLLEEDEVEPAFVANLKQLQDQAIEAQLEQLLEKSRHEMLSGEEKQLLNQLLSVSQPSTNER